MSILKAVIIRLCSLGGLSILTYSYLSGYAPGFIAGNIWAVGAIIIRWIPKSKMLFAILEGMLEVKSMKYYKVIKRETKKGINFKVKAANHRHPFGFEELDGMIQSDNEGQAAAVLKDILKNGLAEAGFKWGNTPLLPPGIEGLGGSMTTNIEWVKNPDGTQGITWNPITGCKNHTTKGLCLDGLFPCYAWKLAHTRLKQRYLANSNLTPGHGSLRFVRR